MKKTFVFLVLAAVSLAACTREELNPEEHHPVVKTVLTVGTAQTKTTLGDAVDGQRQLYWANNDEINVNGCTSGKLTGLAANTTSASFSFDDDLTAPYKALYPASIYKDATTVTLPHNAGNQVIPLGGVSESTTFSLSPLTAMLHLKIKLAASEPDTDHITLIEVSTTDTRMSGEFTIDDNYTALTPAASPTGDDLKVQITGNWTLAAEATSFFIPVPAGEYSFTVKVMDSKGHYMTKSTTSPKEFTAGSIKPLKEFAFEPNQEGGLEIDSPESLIAFAKAYNNRDYAALGNNLIATVTKDLTFDATSSAAFNATGGIGIANDGVGTNYFNGVFDGGNHAIKGLEGTVPIFANTGSNGEIKDLIVKSDCSFSFTHASSVELQAGIMVGYHKGTLKHITVEATPLNLMAVSNVTSRTCLGGLVGRSREGIVDSCSYAGAITIPADFTSTANTDDKGIMIGGLVGWISNGSGIVKSSSFKGTIENEGKLIASSETDALKSAPYLMIGGIVGANAGTVQSCTVNNHASGISVTLSGNDYTGTIVTHSSNAYHYAIAGIAGRNNGTVKGSTNNATILNVFSAERGTSGNLNGRYLNVGGVVGFNAEGAVVKDTCVNNGIIIDRASPKMHYVGGVVGRNFGSVYASRNSATGDITVGTSHFADGPYGARFLYLGGGIGYQESSGSISGLINSGDITVTEMEDSDVAIGAIGGVVGWSTTAISGSVEAPISNFGNILQSNANRKVSDNRDTDPYGYYLGGIVGYTTKGISSVSNSGDIEYRCYSTGSSELEGGARYIYLGGIAAIVKTSDLVDVQYCTNSGNLLFDPTNSAPHATKSGDTTTNTYAIYSYCYLGGIVGYGNRARIKGDITTKTINSGNVYGGCGSANRTSGSTFFVGGIAGELEGASVSISYCKLDGTATVTNGHWSNQSYSGWAPMCGGIVGYIYGSGATVSNCDIANTANVVGTRGDVGGIVGYGRSVTVTDCTVSRGFSGQSAYCFGGIVGWLRSGTIKDCTFSGAKIRTSQMQVGGGVVGYLQDSTIESCNSDVTEVSKNGTLTDVKYGGLAGQSTTNAVIKSSHYKSSIQICSDNNFSTPSGEENANDR